MANPISSFLLRDLFGLTITTCGGKGLFGRRLAPNVGVVPRFVAGEHSPAHPTLAQAHRVRRQIAVGGKHNERFSGHSMSSIIFSHLL